MRLTVERKITAVLGMALLFTLTISLASYRNTASFIENSNRRMTARDGRQKAQVVLFAMDNIEARTREYVITGDNKCLDSYLAAPAAIDRALADLSISIDDVPQLQANLAEARRLIAAELASTSRLIELRRTGGLEAASRALKTGDSNTRTNGIRQTIGAIIHFEEESVAQQDRILSQQARNTHRISGIVGLFSTLFVAGACVAAQKDFNRRRRAEEQLRANAEEQFRLVVEGAREYAIFRLDVEGYIRSWNAGAERIKGYKAEEIIGQHFSRFYSAEEIDAGIPPMELKVARETGQFETNGWRLRKDGSRIWANVVITPLRDHRGNHVGFSKITRDLTYQRRSEDAIAELNKTLRLQNLQLEAANREMEAFTYSVSHDLRSPLRSLDGFSQAILEDYGTRLDAEGQDHLQRIRGASQRMGTLIDGLLDLSRVTRADLGCEEVDLSRIASEIKEELRGGAPGREVEFVIEDGLSVNADPRLLRVVLTNLLGNAWKFTERCPRARIELGRCMVDGREGFFVSDNGAGFDMTYSSKLFGAFQRLHSMTDFAGTGIGLATVRRIVNRYGGDTWAEGKVGEGATFRFTLQPAVPGSTASNENVAPQAAGTEVCHG